MALFEKGARRFRRVAAFDWGAIRRGQRVGRGAVGAPGRRVGGLVPPPMRADKRSLAAEFWLTAASQSSGSSARRETETRACRQRLRARRSACAASMR